MQNHYSLLYREEERDMLPLCRSEGVGVIPWSPLARGRLARPWSEDAVTDRARTDAFGHGLFDKAADLDRPVVDALEGLSIETGVAMARLALAWLLSRPGVTAPIVGATKPVHLEDAVAALSLELLPEQIQRLEASYQPHAPVGF